MAGSTKGRRTLKEYKNALEMAKGYPTKAAELLGVSPGAVSNRIKRNENLRKFYEKLKENRLVPMLDKAESNLVEALNNGEPWGHKIHARLSRKRTRLWCQKDQG
jgi:predicted transcriptional regulator